MSVSLCITATCLEAALTSKSFPAAACPPRLDHVVPWRSPREALHRTASAIVAIVRGLMDTRSRCRAGIVLISTGRTRERTQNRLQFWTLVGV